MKFYDLDTEFSFGKYQGKSVRQIIELQLSYLNWCALNLEHFYMSENVIEEVRKLKPNFSFSEKELQSLNTKYGKWKEKRTIKRFNREDRNSSNWLEDAAGTDDPETMNDVYWNLD